MTLVYLDCETTGLDPNRHEVWEIAYAVDSGPIRAQVVTHDLADADPEALRIGAHSARCNAVRHPHISVEPDGLESALFRALKGATLVAANPAFDAAFLSRRWGGAPWKYRLLDVEAYAMGALGLEEPKGLSFICDHLGVEPGDHTAAGDVRALRECHLILRERYSHTAAAHGLAAVAVQEGIRDTVGSEVRGWPVTIRTRRRLGGYFRSVANRIDPSGAPRKTRFAVVIEPGTGGRGVRVLRDEDRGVPLFTVSTHLDQPLPRQEKVGDLATLAVPPLPSGQFYICGKCDHDLAPHLWLGGSYHCAATNCGCRWRLGNRTVVAAMSGDCGRVERGGR